MARGLQTWWFACGCLTLGISGDPLRADVQRFKFQTPSAYLRMAILRDDLVQFEYSTQQPGPASDAPISTSPMVIAHPFSGAQDIQTDAQTFTTRNLRITVDPATLCIRTSHLNPAYDMHRICVNDTGIAKNISIDAAPTYQDLYGLGQNFPQPEEKNPSWLGRINTPGAFGNELRWFHSGAVGHTQIPVLYALGSGMQNFALFFDHVRKQQWNFQSNPWRMQTPGETIRWFAFAGPNINTLRRTYLDLTGKPELPGKKYFGFWLSEFSYDSWDELAHHQNLMTQNHMPFDGFGLDLAWYGGRFNDPEHSRMGTLRWDTQNFADPHRHIAALKAAGLGLMPIEQPYVDAKLAEHAELETRGLLARDCESCGATYIDHNPWWGRGGMIDYTNPAAGKYWHAEKRLALTQLGVTAHWCDLGEPEMYNDWASYHGWGNGKHRTQADIHNLYNLFWSKSIADAYQEFSKPLRPFILNRSGTAGSQRYFTALWSGDIGGNLMAMIAHFRAQMHLSLSGFDYYSSDIGGFYRPTNDPHTPRLYTIWLANSLMTDIPARTHVWNLDGQQVNNPALIGDAVTNRTNLRTRYAFIPFLYSLARQASATGQPMVAPLLQYWQDDPNARSIDLQKMLGTHLMTKLITNFDGAESVYFPAGDWFDFRDFAKISIPQNRELTISTQTAASQAQVPVFARAGAIVPMADLPEGGFLGAENASVGFVLRVFPSRESSSFKYYDDDDGSTRTAFLKKFLAVNFSQHLSDSTINVDWDAERADYLDPDWQNFRLEIAKLPFHSVGDVRWQGMSLPTCDDEKNPRSYCYSDHQHYLTVRLTPRDLQQNGHLAITLTN